MCDREAIYKSIVNCDNLSFAEWQTMANSVSTNRLQGSIEYFDKYFSVSLSLFKAVLEKQQQKGGWNKYIEIAENYDVLISIIGLTPEPLIHTICALCPKEVYLVVTKEVLRHYNNKSVGKGLKQYFDKWINNASIAVRLPTEVVSSDESLDTFRKVKDIVESIRENNGMAKIAIDITGGKKSSVVSAFFMAAIERDIDIFYVDFEKYDIHINKPTCGTEFLNKLDNPYDIYNIQLLNQAKELFRNYNYQAAFQLFSLIDSKLSSNGIISSALYGLEDEREKVVKMKLASEIYMYWDKFDYADAKDIGCQDFKNIAIVKSLVLPKNIKSIYEVDDQFEYVKKICTDRYANADRRYNQGRYEDALTRYSQSLEMACKSYLIHVIVSEKLSVKFSEKESDKKVNTQLISYDNWVEWKIDYASIAGIISWILCIQNLNWKNDKGFYSLAKLNDSEIKWAIIKKLFIDESLSNNKQKDKIKVYTDLIEHRNDFIHVSSLAAKKEKVDKFKDFVYTIIESIYVNIDMNDYKFSREFNHDGSL